MNRTAGFEIGPEPTRCMRCGVGSEVGSVCRTSMSCLVGPEVGPKPRSVCISSGVCS